MEISYMLPLAMLVLCFRGTYGIDVNPSMRSFSSAIKNGRLSANVEKVLYEHNTGHPGVITEQWFAGANVMDEDMRIRIYIDGENEASLDFHLLLAHGVGFTEALEAQYTPWGIKRMAHSAADGGLYNTYRIPFSKSFNVTATHPEGGPYFYIIRGVENMPLIVGDLTLPANTRLHLYKNVNVKLAPLEFINLASTSNTAGMLFQVTLAAVSTDFNYLEACMRAIIDGADNVTWLSSGTEDFFLSAYYFNRGVFHHENSGLTFKSNPGTMSAYKFFENDPILFTKSFQLMWRCGETEDGPVGCPRDWPPPGQTESHGGFTPKLADTVVTTYTWVYEYTF